MGMDEISNMKRQAINIVGKPQLISWNKHTLIAASITPRTGKNRKHHNEYKENLQSL